MGAAVGIDLGTTNTVVAAVRDGRAVTLPDETGRRLIPSTVSFHPNGSVLVGEPARERRLIDPTNTIYSVKRLIGRSWQSEEVQQARPRFPFELREGSKNSTLVTARGEMYALPEISAFVLRRAKAIAEQALGEPVDRAVITVPANFNDLQRASTKVAGKLAGLEVLRILNEPTAAALAYGQTATTTERLAVYDLGGGTFDITLLDLSGNVFEVLATAGDTALGGDDIDLVIADAMADKIVRTHRFDPRVDVTEFARLRIFAERLKLELSTETEASIDLTGIGGGEGGEPITTSFRMTRDELEQETASMAERTLEVCRFAIETVSLRIEDIDRVILVGGPTRMPLIAREVQNFFQKSPALKVNPDEVVALGAAIQAHALDRGRKRATTSAGAPAPNVVVTQGPPAAPSGPPIPRITAQNTTAPAPPRPSPPPLATSVPPLLKHLSTNIPGPVIRSVPPPRQTDRPLDEGGLFGSEDPDDEPTRERIKPSPPPPSFEQQPIMTAGESMPPVFAPTRAEPPPPPHTPIAPPAEMTIDLPKPDMESLSLPRGVPSLMFDSAQLQSPPPPPPGAPSLPPVPPRPQIQPYARFVPPTSQASVAEPAPSIRPPEPAAPIAVAFAAPSAPPRGAPLLIDVTPLSLRVETVGGYCDVLIGANTAVPCDRTRVFLTAADGQTTVIVRVAQGESNRFTENTFLGELELTGLTPAARGETQIGVTFEIDADGILNVKAKDVKSGRETRSRLQLLGAQTDQADVDEMMDRQKQHAVM